MNRKIIAAAMLLLLTSCSNSSGEKAEPSGISDQSQSEAQGSGETVSLADPTIHVTDSGLKYEILRAADGPKPTESSIITVHYKGVLNDGTEFDSSYARGEPSTFNLSGTILGWVEGLQLMSVGAEYRFYIPPQLAYGERGAGALIGPNEELIFNVELLEINSN